MKELRKIPTEKLGYRQAAAGPYLHVSARRGNKKKQISGAEFHVSAT